MSAKLPECALDAAFLADVRACLSAERALKRALPERGRMLIERPVPFLCVYRRPRRHPDAGTEKLIGSESAFLQASAAPRLRRDLERLVRAVVEVQVGAFGGALVVEIWSRPPDQDPEAPRFRIVAPRRGCESFLDDLHERLSRFRIGADRAAVDVEHSTRVAPPGLPPLLPAATVRELGCTVIGLEVPPVYRDPVTGVPYPALYRRFKRQLSLLLRQTFYRFACAKTIHCPVHFQVMGPSAIVKAVWNADRALARVANRFDYLLQVTPTNGQQAWAEFQNRGYEQAPRFHYRPLPRDPLVLKRELFAAPVERIEDPALAQLFREKVDEIDRQITLLDDRGTSRFLHTSVQLFGGVSDALLAAARGILERIPARARDDSGPKVTAEEFAQKARREIAYYRRRYPAVTSEVEIRDDVTTGLMVSKGNLLVGSVTLIPRKRVAALVHHEIGTHVLTYWNGKAQPFQQLYLGLASYEALQEGIAVFAEYLCGGLSRPRLRLLAARVVAVRALLDGASFVETFRLLHDHWGFELGTAFTITVRIYRGGGLTKDAVYLEGLQSLLGFLRRGGDLGSLFVGKIAQRHLPIIRELRHRQILVPPPLVPRYLGSKLARERLARAQRGLELHELAPAGR